MLDKRFLESFLKLNNGSERMSDAEVHDVLAKAGWSESEISAALTLLRTKGDGAPNPQADTSSTLTFRPDLEFSSSQLSALLGVDVHVDPRAIQYTNVSGTISRTRSVLGQAAIMIGIVLLSLSLAAAAGIGGAYWLEIGPFTR